MKLLEIICKELGVNVGEGWETKDGGKYKVDKEYGLMYWSDLYNEWTIPQYYHLYLDLLKGELNPVWKPKWGEDYFAPDIYSESNYVKYKWTDSNLDNQILNRGFVFKTKEEAEETTVKILNILGSDK